MVKPAKDRMRDNLSEPLDPRLVIQSIRFEYLPELIAANGEAAVRAILESHFISSTAFDILRRDPFGPDDFEAFRTIDEALGGDAVSLPPHVLQKIDERLQAAARKNAALDLNYYQTLGGRLEYADLREVQDAILSKAIWPLGHQRTSWAPAR